MKINQIVGCCHYFIRFNGFSLGKYNPHSSGSWFLEFKDKHYLIRKTLFWWSHLLQAWLYKRGIYWHNWIIDECTPGFECCMHKVKDKNKQMLKDLAYVEQEQMTGLLVTKDGDNEKWLKTEKL